MSYIRHDIIHLDALELSSAKTRNFPVCLKPKLTKKLLLTKYPETLIYIYICLYSTITDVSSPDTVMLDNVSFPRPSED